MTSAVGAWIFKGISIWQMQVRDTILNVASSRREEELPSAVKGNCTVI